MKFFHADFLEIDSKLVDNQRVIHLSHLWHVLVEGLNPIWPSRIQLAGKSLGDVWPCPALKKALATEEEGEDLVPFHKLTQWITYSLVEVLEKIAKWKVEGLEDLTGLPEYRNGMSVCSQYLHELLYIFHNRPGGLLIDHGVLILKPDVLPVDPGSGLPSVPPSHPAIIEWRAMTVIEL